MYFFKLNIVSSLANKNTPIFFETVCERLLTMNAVGTWCIKASRNLANQFRTLFFVGENETIHVCCGRRDAAVGTGGSGNFF